MAPHLYFLAHHLIQVKHLSARLLVAPEGSEGFVDRVDGVVRDMRGHHSGGWGHGVKILELVRGSKLGPGFLTQP